MKKLFVIALCALGAYFVLIELGWWIFQRFLDLL